MADEPKSGVAYPERRTVPAKFRLEDKDDSPMLIGHAALFDVRIEIGGAFEEIVKPGAFASSIGRDDIRALFNHDPNFILGRTKVSKTLRLEEDALGLAFEVDPPTTPTINDLVLAPIKRRDLSQMSYAFSPEKDGEEWDPKGGKNGMALRTLTKVRLYDISPVTYPANKATSVKVRSALQKAGIDADRLDQIISGALESGELDDRDQSFIAATRNILSSYLKSEDPQGGEPSGAHEPLTILSRRLALVEADL